MVWSSSVSKRHAHLKKAKSGGVDKFGYRYFTGNVQSKRVPNNVSAPPPKFSGSVVFEHLELPETMRPTMDQFRDIPDEEVPPIIALLRRKKDLGQPRDTLGKGILKNQDWHTVTLHYGRVSCIFVKFSGRRAYIFELSETEGVIRQSCEYDTDRARLLASEERKHSQILWKEELPLSKIK